METERPTRRRRSRRRARKKQIAWLVFGALVIGAIVWTRILIDRHHQATLFAEETALRAAAKANAPTVATATKNLIVFIGSGYGFATTTAARLYAGGERGSLMVDIFPESAIVRTYSRDAQGADRAAAMSAYMTGLKVNNGVVSQGADSRSHDESGSPYAAHLETSCPAAEGGKPATTLLELAKGAGRAVGLVTTARVTAAVLAASYAHLCHSDGENTIAVQLVPGGHDANPKLGEGVDVVFGGGWENFLPKGDPRGSVRNDARDLFAEMRAKGYVVINRQTELAVTTVPLGKMIGLFSRSGMRFDTDRVGSGEPSLTDMTSRAIDLLKRNAAGYLLIVEAGRIADGIDGAQIKEAMGDASAFDKAIEATLAKVRELDPELRNTTIVVTADHDQALVITGNAADAGRTSESRPGVLGIVRGYAEPTQAAVDASGRPYTNLVGAVGRRVKGPRSQAPPVSDLVVAERGYRYEATLEGNGSPGASDVMLSAIGANTGGFHGTLDNTQVFTLLRSAMGL